MLKLKWSFRQGITSVDDITRLVNDANECRPNISGFDTETTGLHIIFDKPFLFQFGFANTHTKKAYVYYIDLEQSPEIARQAIIACWKIANRTIYLVGHNIKYDMHMMINYGIPYEYDNITDSQIMIRLGTDAVPEKRGGAPLALKNYASQYIDKGARFHDDRLRSERATKAAEFNKKLQIETKKLGLRWKEVQEYLDDGLNTIEGLAPGFEKIYDVWFQGLPEKIQFNMNKHYVESKDIPYYMLNRHDVGVYGQYDVVYTIEVAVSLIPVLKIRKQWGTFQQENELIRPLLEMEREGFFMNTPYVEEAQVKLREYILETRKKFVKLAGEPLKSSQSARIIGIMQNRFGLNIQSSGKEVLEELLADTQFLNDPKNKDAIAFIDHLQELRTMEKWYTTYLMRFLKESKRSNKIYTTVHQAGPVTGRVSSDFQQFPKDAIYDLEGNELFNPRLMVKVGDTDDGIAYLDYSQIELRFQLWYIILLGEMDLNLGRAYMPVECFRWDGVEKIPFKFETEEQLSEWNKYDWLLNESEEPWTPTDIHSATTIKAFPEIADGITEFMGHTLSYWRGHVGKGTNFAKNYGAQLTRIKIMFRKFNFSEEKLKQIDESYYEAFPGIKLYHKYCYSIARNGFMTNLFGRRYYGISGHNGINALIQGSSADFLKRKIIELNKYIKEKGYKTRMIMNIHDEIQFVVRNNEWIHLWEFQEIMQKLPESQVPIIADMEVTKTLWGEKVEVSSVQDIDAIARG